MLTIAGYNLPEVIHEDAETVTCRGTRVADGAHVRVHFLRNPRPDEGELTRWRAAIERLRREGTDGTERLLAVHPFGAADAIVFDDDGKVPLAGLLSPAIPLPVVRALFIARVTTAAVDRLHRDRTVHGRISAAAVWVHPTRDVAALVDVATDPRYRAPEQWERREGTDGRSDLYAIGVLLYHALCGEPPWSSTDPVELAHAHAARTPPDPRTRRPEIPGAVAAIIIRLLAKSAGDRYQTAYGLLVDLQALEDATRAGQSPETIVLGHADRAAVFALPNRLYGRQREIETLRMALDRSRWGRSEPVLLTGAPGVGKSALAAALREDTQREGGFFIAGKFDQYKRNVPYSAVAQAFAALVHQIASESEEAVEQWRGRILAAVGANARVLIDVVPEIELLTGTLPPAPALGPFETRNRFNTVFREFIQLVGRPERPLVVLLDDLQWADSASISLFTMLAIDTGLPHLLLLGAYRDGEAGGATLVTTSLEELRDAGIACTTLTLAPLALADTTAIVADTVFAPPARAAELGALVHGMTGGNPFFLRQFLRTLHDDGLLSFDSTSGSWSWELPRVRARAYSESVVELMAARLSRLSADSRSALRVASCVGATFTLRVVAAALEVSPALVVVALADAVDDGLIEADVSGGAEREPRYRFVHDRAQQASYALIPAAERSTLRRKIGQVMREMLSPAELDDALFEVVTNLSEGLVEVRDPAARTDLAKLSLDAGHRARASLAYDDARRFLQTGLAAIEGQPGEREYGFALRSALFECSYLTSRFHEADALFDRLLADAPGVMERAHIYNTKILIDTSQGRSVEAVRLGIEAVRDFGVKMPVKPGVLSVLWGLAKVTAAVRRRETDALLQLPQLTDPRHTAAIGLLLRIGPAAYFNNTEAFVLSALNIVKISLRHGNTAGSSFGYVIYAMVLGAKLGNVARAQQFGKLAVALSDRLDTTEIRPKVHMIFGGFVNFWSEPYQSSIRILADAFALGVEAGDLQYAGYCRSATLYLVLAFGVPLEEVIALGDRYEPFVRQANETFTVDSQALMRQRARALAGRTVAGDRLSSDGFDEASWLQAVRDSNNLTTLGYYQVARLQLSLLFRDLDTAARIGEDAYTNREALLSQIQSAELHLYYGLVLAALVRAPVSNTGAHRRMLARCRKFCTRLARGCAANYEPWHLLLEAESAPGGDAALSMYDRAIESARRNDQPNIEGLAAELAARSQLAAGRRTVAQSYLRDAVNAYSRWQAMAKVHHLIGEFAELLPEQALMLVAPTAALRSRSVSIDVEAAMIAVHALAGETAIDRLLERLLRIAIEGAGAELGQVVLTNDAGLYVAAIADAEQDQVVLGPTPLTRGSRMCVPVVQTVARRGSPVIIEDAIEDPQFGGTPDVRARRPRSIACIPILAQERLLGALYVENNLAPGAFTPERVRLLKLMASELAVAVERARLTDVARESSLALVDAMRRVGQLEKSKAHLGKFVPRSVQRIIDANPDAPALEKRECDVTILFLDIEGYTRLTESLPRERLDWLVRTYFSRFLDIVLERHGEINETAGDGLMILFQDDDATVHAANACRAAIEIGRASRELNMTLASQFPPVVVNIGINSGAALVGSTRLQGSGDARWTFTATGAVTNVAARLGAFATGGAVVVSEATAGRVDGDFVLESAGPQHLKNVSEPVVLFKLVDKERQG